MEADVRAKRRKAFSDDEVESALNKLGWIIEILYQADKLCGVMSRPPTRFSRTVEEWLRDSDYTFGDED